jgi:ABC-type oligopeptide transport system ATPase subunit
MSFEFKEAKREAAPVFIGIEGESGSGKTYSALLLARGMVGPTGKIGVIDSEGRRSLMYANDEEIGGFLHMDLVAPYSSDRFRQAIHAAVRAGIDAIVIDSASHEHEAEGGMLDFADQEEARGVKPRAKWIKPKMQHNRFIRTALSCGAHIIFCIRVKTIVDTEVKPAVKVKFPVCESNLPYEFTVRLRVENEGIAHFEKVPKPFQKHIRQGERISVAHGALLMQEAGKGEDNSRMKAIVTNLEEAATSGTEVFKTAWKAAWRNHGPEGDVKTMTPERAELNKHLDRIKRIAEEADAASNDDSAGEREPDDIGKTSAAEKPKETTRDNAYDDDFPGDR